MWHAKAGSCFLFTAIAWPSHPTTLEFFSCSFRFWTILDFVSILSKFMFQPSMYTCIFCEAVIAIVWIKVRLAVVGLTWLPGVCEKKFQSWSNVCPPFCLSQLNAGTVNHFQLFHLFCTQFYFLPWWNCTDLGLIDMFLTNQNTGVVAGLDTNTYPFTAGK